MKYVYLTQWCCTCTSLEICTGFSSVTFRSIMYYGLGRGGFTTQTCADLHGSITNNNAVPSKWADFCSPSTETEFLSNWILWKDSWGLYWTHCLGVQKAILNYIAGKGTWCPQSATLWVIIKQRSTTVFQTEWNHDYVQWTENSLQIIKDSKNSIRLNSKCLLELSRPESVIMFPFWGS